MLTAEEKNKNVCKQILKGEKKKNMNFKSVVFSGKINSVTLLVKHMREFKTLGEFLAFQQEVNK